MPMGTLIRADDCQPRVHQYPADHRGEHAADRHRGAQEANAFP